MSLVMTGILLSITSVTTNIFAILYRNLLLSDLSVGVGGLALGLVVFGFFKEETSLFDKSYALDAKDGKK